MKNVTNRSKLAAMLSGAAVLGLTVSVAAPAQTTTTAAKVASISAKDKQMGAEAHPQLVAEFGGAMQGGAANYAETIGKNIAVHSGLSNAKGDFTVTLLNSSVNNAFAIPGGYIYVTRQLMALMNNEAELAGVLGHEVRHVSGRHSTKRKKAATRNSILGVLGTVLSGVLLGDSGLGKLGQQVFSQGSQMLTLKYSRGQEIDADNGGIAMLKLAGYDPRAMSTVLASLANQNALEARLQGNNAQVPEWASTHPDPKSRVAAALAKAGAKASGNLNRATFLGAVDGMLYGDDPKQGVVEGRDFTHADLRFYFQAPAGFYMVNGTQAVSIAGQSGKAQFTGAKFDGNLETYVRAGFAALTPQGQQQLAPTTLERTTVNGIPAAVGKATVNGGSGNVDVVIFAYEFASDQAFHFVTITQAGQGALFNPMFASMRRISQAEAAAIKPRKVDVVTVKSGDTVQSLAARMAYGDAKLDRFLILNALTANSTVSVGDKVKIVTF